MTTPNPTPQPVAHVVGHNPNACSNSTCQSTPTAQYRVSDGQGNTLAVFACPIHAYTDPTQQVATHSTTCTLFPCNCNPTAPAPTPATSTHVAHAGPQ